MTHDQWSPIAVHLQNRRLEKKKKINSIGALVTLLNIKK